MRVEATDNYGPRRDGRRPELVVLHYTAMTGGPERVVDVFRDPARAVSAHYVLGTDGAVIAMVPEDRRAWHAGAASWRGCTDVNSASIGVELCNDGASPFAARQMDALEALLADIMDRHRIPPAGVIGHSDCAPGRKIDPGPRFDWRRLARRGLAVLPRSGGNGEDDFFCNIRRFGYTAHVGDDMLLAAFRLRFRPGVAGPLSDADRALAAGLPVGNFG